jgi:uncharacterized RDD family membrane protein YckC
MPIAPRYPEAMDDTPLRPRPLIGWRMLALLYDLFPAFGLWFLVAAGFVAVHRDAVLGGTLGLLEFATMWLVTGAYAVVSWRRGGRTIGMRPWRLRVAARDGGRASVAALMGRYAIGSVSLLLVGAGFWWAWIDRDGLAWHDRVSGTRMVRDARPAT